MSNVKVRMQALGLLDRSFKATSDDELAAAVDVLSDDHREALQEFVGGDPAPSTLRDVVRSGRLDGGMESVAAVLTDACLADCIEQLGDHAENPSTDQLREVLPGLVERHGKGITQIMLASTVAGEAPAASIIRDLLKNDDLVQLPKAESSDSAPLLHASSKRSDAEQEELRAQRKAARKAKQQDANARKAQAAQAKRRR